MEVFEPLDGLLMFNTYLAPINLSFNQYLLMGREPLLVHTGNVAQATELAPRLARTLAGQPLKHIFVSHFEADECGGLAHLLAHFPGARVLCSAVTARQLAGFGISEDAMAKRPGEEYGDGDLRLEFLSYPSEAHLWEGLLGLESHRGLLFSADLFIRQGQVTQPMLVTRWSEEVPAITEAQVPSPAARKVLQESLAGLPVRFIAPGHGPVLEVQ